MTRRSAFARRGAEGFSLVEALVALVVAALTLAAVFELQQQIAQSQRRYERALDRARAQENALVLLQNLNPAATPRGETVLGAERVRWTSTPLGREIRNAGFPSGDGAFMLRLYRVDLVVLAADGRPVTEVSVERVGWRRIGVLGDQP